MWTSIFFLGIFCLELEPNAQNPCHELSWRASRLLAPYIKRKYLYIIRCCLLEKHVAGRTSFNVTYEGLDLLLKRCGSIINCSRVAVDEESNLRRAQPGTGSLCGFLEHQVPSSGFNEKFQTAFALIIL